MSQVTETVIVTGSSSGIGLAVARAFLARGASVVLHGRDAEKLERAADSLRSKGRIAAVAGDVREKATGEALARAAVDRFGGLDVLVNNAGAFASRAFLDVGEEELDRYLSGNLRGAYLATQAAVRTMKERGGGGAIVNIGTVLVDHAVAGLPASAPIVSKGGIQALTVSLAAELARDQIRVNMVSPGIVRTPLHAGADLDALGSLALLDRVAEAGEIADAVLYLARAAFVTGQVLRVDGGFVSGRA